MIQPRNDIPQDLTSTLLWLEGTSQKRQREPVTCGMPWPPGVLKDASHLQMKDEGGRPILLQARVLDRWPDGSVRWVLLDWQASVSGPASVTVGLVSQTVSPAAGELHASSVRELITINTGPTQFQLRAGGTFPFEAVTCGVVNILDTSLSRFKVEDEAGHVYEPFIRRLHISEQGPIRLTVCVEGQLVCSDTEPLADFLAYLHFFAGSPTVRFDITIRNPRKAEHPGGLWDLGNGGSVYIRDAAITVALAAPEGPSEIACSPEIQSTFEPFSSPLEVYQDSSGGENWQSSNHLNRRRVVPNTFCGYRLRSSGTERTGRRATPIITLDRHDQQLAITMRHFWQDFPKALEATADSVTLRLFPRQYADLHELQGGEQKTHQFYIAFGPDTVTQEPLAWCRDPLLVRAAPAWYCATGAISYLTPKESDPNKAYLRLVDAAIEGEDTFERKRELVDEYGWRHFGDIYADHEAVFQNGPPHLVSHYNNQYDPLAGFAYQFLRSGDSRWWHYMIELARHVIDIDIYHTGLDKAAYNNGLFWHTFHYTDADTGTHRSYPRQGRIAAGAAPATGHEDPGASLPWSPRKGTVCGGGPANEHNYATGLMLHHFLTGDPLSRQTAIDLAQWVIDVDDGGKTPFRWLCRGDTGLASSSGSPLYHGPGRGAGNSVNALLDGHRLTQDPKFLAKAERLIRRCIHPEDDLDRRNLLDAERRWYYTVFLQALGRYLDYKAEHRAFDFCYAYARESLLHYARWMAAHEYPILQKPELLEYPTETWAAQDMRKSEVFKYAAKYAAGDERIRFLERADFFFESSTSSLAQMKTRTLARPVVLMLSYGFMHAYFQQNQQVSAPPGRPGPHNFGHPETFVPQKVRAKKRFLYLAATAAAIALVGSVYLLVRFWPG